MTISEFYWWVGQLNTVLKEEYQAQAQAQAEAKK